MGTLPPIRQWTLVKRTFSSEPIICWSYRKYLPTSGAFTPSGGGKWYSRVKVDGTVTMYWFIGSLVYISAVLTYLLGTVSHALWPWATRLAEENDQHFSDFFQLGNPTRTKDSRESARRDSAKVYLFVTGEQQLILGQLEYNAMLASKYCKCPQPNGLLYYYISLMFYLYHWATG